MSIVCHLLSTPALTVFLVVMSNFILLIGAGLFTKAVSAFQKYAYVSSALLPFSNSSLICNSFNKLLGKDVDDAGGTGPGSYDVRGNVWHLDCCAPDAKTSSEGWSIFSAFFGWTNNATGS